MWGDGCRHHHTPLPEVPSVEVLKPTPWVPRTAVRELGSQGVSPAWCPDTPSCKRASVLLDEVTGPCAQVHMATDETPGRLVPSHRGLRPGRGLPSLCGATPDRFFTFCLCIIFRRSPKGESSGLSKASRASVRSNSVRHSLLSSPCSASCVCANSSAASVSRWRISSIRCCC